MKVVALSMFAVVAVATARSADACQCLRDPAPQAYGIPTGKVPCNAHVFLRDVQAIGKVTLVAAATKAVVPFTHVQLAPGFYELVPKRLAPDTEYAVVENGHTVLRFETTAQRDTQPPLAEGVTGELVVNQIRDSCDSGIKPYVKAQVSIPTGAERPPLIAVWRGDERGKVDFAKPPHAVATLVLADSGLRFELGYFNLCSRPNMAVSGRIYGVRLIDVAGNRSVPLTLTLPTDEPRPR